MNRALTTIEFIDAAGMPYPQALDCIKKGFELLKRRYLESTDLRVINMFQFSEIMPAPKLQGTGQTNVLIHLTAVVEISGDSLEEITPVEDDISGAFN